MADTPWHVFPLQRATVLRDPNNTELERYPGRYFGQTDKQQITCSWVFQKEETVSDE